MTRTHESKSSIETSACKLRYFLKYIEGMKEVTGEPAIIGKAIHLAIENALNRASLTGQYIITIDDIAQAYFQEGTPTPDEYLINAVIGNFHKLEAMLFEDHEQEIDLKTNYGIRAIIDVLSVEDKQAVIIDHKTSRAMQPDYELGKSWQTLTNIAVVFENYPAVEEITMIYWFWRFGKKGVVPLVYHRGEYKTIKPFLVSAVERCRTIQASPRPEGTPGDYCLYCGNSANCAQNINATIDNPEVLAKRITLYSEQSKKDKALLKKHYQELPAPEFTGQPLWTIESKTIYKARPGLLNAILESATMLEAFTGNTLEKMLSISKDTLEKLHTLPEFNELIEEKHGSTFTTKKWPDNKTPPVQQLGAVDTNPNNPEQPGKEEEHQQPTICEYCKRPLTKKDAEKLNPSQKRYHICDCNEPATGKRIGKHIYTATGQDPTAYMKERWGLNLAEITNKKARELVEEWLTVGGF